MTIPDDNDDDSTVTEADLAEAQERWADPQHEPSAPELFSRPVYGPGFRGDMPLDPAAKGFPKGKWPRADIAALLRGFDAAGDERADWYEALIAAALQTTGGDIGAAVKLADKALKKQPSEPADADDARPHGELVARFAEACDEPDGLLEVLDVPQDDSSSCGAAASMSVGRFFGVGPTRLADWKQLLGTDADAGTPPESIVAVLRLLGLDVDAQHGMSLDDLRDCWEQGWPVIAPIQDYGPDAGAGDYEDGHYVTVIGGPALGYVFVQDSMADVELEGSHTDAAPGKVMIAEERFLDVWHDESAAGKKYVRFGIIVKGHAI